MPISDHERLTRQFFRSVNSVALLRRFFQGHGVWERLGITEGARNDDAFTAWEAYTGPERAKVHDELCRINDIARERGRFTLQGRARECGVEDLEKLTLPKLALTLYLDHRAVFDAAYDFYALEKTDNLHALVGDDPVPCAPTAEQIERFKERLRATLHGETEGQRLRVEVEARHPDKWMAAIPHQTYVRPDHEFDDDSDEIVTRDRRPVYEMILIYYPRTGVLKLRAGRGRKKVESVASIFATEVLGRGPLFFRVCDIVNFEPLYDPGFSFVREPGDVHQWAVPTQIGYRRRARSGYHYHLICREVYEGSPGVLGALRQDGVSLSEIEIDSLSVCFKFPKHNRDTRTVDLGMPNRVSLDETERDRYIEGVLSRLRLIDHEARDRLDGADGLRQAV